MKFLTSSLLASTSPYNLINVWNLTNGLTLYTVFDNTLCFEVLYNDNLVIASVNSTVIKILSLVTGTDILVATNYQTFLKQINASYLASGDMTGRINIWNLISLELVTYFTGHSGPIVGLIPLYTGYLVSGSQDKTIKVWNMATGVCVNTLNPFGSQITSIEIITKNTLAVGGFSNQVVLIQVNQLGQLNIIFNITVPDSSVSGLKLTTQGVLLIATNGGLLGYYNLTSQSLSTVSIGANILSMDIYS